MFIFTRNRATMDKHFPIRAREAISKRVNPFFHINCVHEKTNEWRYKLTSLLFHVSDADLLFICIVTCYTMQKSCFHRAVPKRAEERRRKPTKAEPTKGRNVYTSLLRNGWLHTLRRYAISTTIATVFGGVRSEELSWKPSAIQSQFVRSSPTSQFARSSLKKWIRGVSSRRQFRSVKM
jgi:hypothetical protein